MRLLKDILVLSILLSLPIIIGVEPDMAQPFQKEFMGYELIKNQLWNLNLWYVVPMIVYSALVLTFIYKIGRFFKPKWRVKKAQQILNKIRSFEGDNQSKRIMNYLRQIDPFVFEEMLLTCFKEAGVRIKRNKRYTGDGGIDGKIWLKRKKVLIQAKRYKGHIKKQHVVDFDELCRHKKLKGLFIHTGSIGKHTQAFLNNSDCVGCIGDEQLIRLIQTPHEMDFAAIWRQ